MAYNNLPTTTLIIAVYNKVHYLRLVMAGLQRQSVRNFEVIIADDGSSEEQVTQIKALLSEMPFPTKHLWQADEGFRKNKIMNRAITEAAGEYLVFIDGDCVPHYRFMEEHLKQARIGYCLTGRRVNLSEKITAKLTTENVKAGILERMHLTLIMDAIGKTDTFVERGFYVQSAWLRALINRKERGLLGCNISVFKADMLAVNGFDERYKLPSIGEDTDIEFRLRLNGVKIKPLNNVAIQYHLYHRDLPRPEENLALFRQVERDAVAYTPFGISKK